MHNIWTPCMMEFPDQLRDGSGQLQVIALLITFSSMKTLSSVVLREAPMFNYSFCQIKFTLIVIVRRQVMFEFLWILLEELVAYLEKLRIINPLAFEGEGLCKGCLGFYMVSKNKEVSPIFKLNWKAAVWVLSHALLPIAFPEISWMKVFWLLFAIPLILSLLEIQHSHSCPIHSVFNHSHSSALLHIFFSLSNFAPSKAPQRSWWQSSWRM